MTEVAQHTGSDQTALRPFQVNVPEAELTELRRRIHATRWPDRETDAAQGVQLATMQALARYWATEYDWRPGRGAAERAPAVPHRDRWGRHSFPARAFAARRRVAAHRLARMARLGHRAAEDPRAPDQSHGAWRPGIGRFPRGDSAHAGLRVFGQADHDRLGPRAYRTGLDRADAAPRLPALCRPRRRLGWGGGGHDGGRRRPGIARHSHHDAWRCASRRVEGGSVRRSGALRSLRRGKTAVREDA